MITIKGHIPDKINISGKIAEPIHITSKINVSASVKHIVTFVYYDEYGDETETEVQVSHGKKAKFSGTVPAKDGNDFLGWVVGEDSPINPAIDTDVFDETIYQQIPNVTEDIMCWAVYDNKQIIRDSWTVISQRSQAGTASDYYNVGDMKRVHLSGTVGTKTLSRDLYVHILGFDHNSTIEGSGITFGCFRDLYNYQLVGLLGTSDNNYHQYTDGTKSTNMNHWGSLNYGGWAGSDLRYDILGSTDVAPSGYGAIPDSSRVGYDATSTCATNPVANTLMSCLPSDLRAVMKPITKYTDNVGGGTDSSTNVTSTVDYLPLMSLCECLGNFDSSAANSYEKDNQRKYSGYNENICKLENWTENEKTSYNIDFDGALAFSRSPNKNTSDNFCTYHYNAGGGIMPARFTAAIAPVFLV